MFRQNSLYPNRFNQQQPVYLIKNEKTQPILETPIPKIENIKTEPIIKKIDSIPVKIDQEIIVDKIQFTDKNDIYEYIDTKFSKFDEALMMFKNNKYPHKEIEENIIPAEKTMLKKRQTDFTPEKINIKKKRKEYQTITEDLFTDIKDKYPQFPESEKPNIVTDGDDFYLSKKNKKIPLNKMNVLKMINKSNK